MSTPEQTAPEQVDARSSIKLSRNAKGDTQIEVKVRAGDTPAEVEDARQLAVNAYDALRRAYP